MNEKTSKHRTQRNHLIIIMVIAFLLIILEVASKYPEVTTPFERLELLIQDMSFRIRGTAEPHEDIIIIAIDDNSLSYIDERWPWNRSRFAELINYFNDAGARVIALDMFFIDPSNDPEEDQALAEAIANANNVVVTSQVFNYAGQQSEVHERPLAIFRPDLFGWGISEIHRDDDAIVRSIDAFRIFDQDYVYNWSYWIASAYLGEPLPTTASAAQMNFNGVNIPLNNQGRMLINFAGPTQTYPTYSVVHIFEGDYSPEIFRDKIILIGATSETLQDLYPTPFSTTTLTPGVEVIANSVDTILSGRYYQTTPPFVTIILILFMAALAWLLLRIPRPTYTIGLVLGIILGYTFLAGVIFIILGWQFAVVLPLLMLFLGVLIPTAEQAVTQEIEKRRVRGLFSRFISPEMVKQILDTEDINSLNKRTELTILFSDIRGFTRISERLSPDQVVALLNPYLEVMTQIIHKYGGTVDKYEGDAIVAFFGEPIRYKDHALRAVFSALEMRMALKRLTQEWREQGTFIDEFEMGIGINTGEVFVGLLGSEQRVNYTVIGDAANLAARLQDQTKELNWPILISKSTYLKVEQRIRAEFAISQVLRGRQEPVDIYRLIGLKKKVD